MIKHIVNKKMFVSIYLPLPPPLSDGDKKQADFSCMDARKAVY